MTQILKVRVKTKSGRSLVESTEKGLVVYVKSLPEKGRANQEVLRLMADFFRIRLNDVEIKSGTKSQNKLIILPDSVEIGKIAGGKNGRY